MMETQKTIFSSSVTISPPLRSAPSCGDCTPAWNAEQVMRWNRQHVFKIQHILSSGSHTNREGSYATNCSDYCPVMFCCSVHSGSDYRFTRARRHDVHRSTGRSPVPY